MKAFTNPTEYSSVGWPHPSLCGEAPRNFGADERNQTGILTWALNLIPPSRTKHAVALEFVAVTVAQPSRILTGFPDI